MTQELTTYEKVQRIAEEYDTTVTRDELCTEDHPRETTAAICLPAGGHTVLDQLEEYGLRVIEIPAERAPCHKKNHHKRVYVGPIEYEHHS